MSQNNSMFQWKNAKEHYDTLVDGSIHIHEDAPQWVKDSFQDHERLMGKVKAFPKKRASLRKVFNKSETDIKVKHEPQRNKNVKAIFDGYQKKEIAKLILDDLRNWFGIETAKQEYIDESASMPFWAYYRDGEPVGFIAIKKHNCDSAEVYVMGVLNEYQRSNIGNTLLKESEDWCRNDGIKYLQVKTVSADSDDQYYAATRKFYNAVGFSPLEVFLTLWDENNPCLLMIKKLSF